jgi:hypothetical protein
VCYVKHLEAFISYDCCLATAIIYYCKSTELSGSIFGLRSTQIKRVLAFFSMYSILDSDRSARILGYVIHEEFIQVGGCEDGNLAGNDLTASHMWIAFAM